MSISPPRTASDNYKVELSPFPAGDRLLISCIVSDLNREQVVTVRREQLTTLQALDMSNG